MTSFEPIIRMDENAFRAPEKMQLKARRKPLGDVTNSSKPLGKDKLSAKTFNIPKSQLKVQPPKTGRKPLGDLTNSNKHRANEKSSKKTCAKNLSAVCEEKNPSWILNEGFLHNHDECIKSRKKSMVMSMEYYLETVGLKRDSSVSLFPEVAEEVATTTEKSELEIPMELDKVELEMMDVSPPSPLALMSPPTPKSPPSPFGTIDWKNLELLPLKLKESPTRD